MWSSNVCRCWLSAKLQEILKSASHCYGSHLHFALEAEVNTQSLILLFSPSVAAGRWVRNLHWLYQTSPDKMKILAGYLRENAYTKCDPSSISEPCFSTAWGAHVLPPRPVCVTVCRVSHSPPGWLGSPWGHLSCHTHTSTGKVLHQSRLWMATLVEALEKRCQRMDQTVLQ